VRVCICDQDAPCANMNQQAAALSHVIMLQHLYYVTHSSRASLYAAVYPWLYS
jgi:hypothetical protein